MPPSNEAEIRIFISSTDYDLKDLRAELARYLQEMSYRPILSSQEGFPDSTPDQQPWESCLPVVRDSQLVVTIIDCKYGKSLEWPNYKEILGSKKLSPTHAEYAYAHKTGKRILVFVRDEIQHYYQDFRNALKTTKNKHRQARKILEKVLPDRVQYETLEFLQYIKTSSPIPWIRPFQDVTDIKTDLQKKLVNDLAEVLAVKTARMDALIEMFSRAIAGLGTKDRDKVLLKIGATRELVEQVEKRSQELKELKTQLASTEKKRKQADERIKRFKGKDNERKKLRNSVEQLTNEKAALAGRVSSLEQENVDAIGSYPKLTVGSTMRDEWKIGGSHILSKPVFIGGPANQTFKGSVGFARGHCPECGDVITSVDPIIFANEKKCASCRHIVCSTCTAKRVTFEDPFYCKNCRP